MAIKHLLKMDTAYSDVWVYDELRNLKIFQAHQETSYPEQLFIEYPFMQIQVYKPNNHPVAQARDEKRFGFIPTVSVYFRIESANVAYVADHGILEGLLTEWVNLFDDSLAFVHNRQCICFCQHRNELIISPKIWHTQYFSGLKRTATIKKLEC